MGSGVRGGIALLACVASGCAFTFTETVSDSYDRSQTPRCTASRGLAATDGLYAATFGLLALVFAALDDSIGDDDELDALVVTTGGIAAIFGVSAYFGTRWTTECREAFDRHDAWLATPAPAPNLGAPGTHPASATPDRRAPATTTRAGRDGQTCHHTRSNVPEVNSRHGRASAAAAAGNCDAVHEHAAAIKALDAGYYLNVLRCDEAIRKACELPSP